MVLPDPARSTECPEGRTWRRLLLVVQAGPWAELALHIAKSRVLQEIPAAVVLGPSVSVSVPDLLAAPASAPSFRLSGLAWANGVHVEIRRPASRQYNTNHQEEAVALSLVWHAHLGGASPLLYSPA